jgi:type IV fimbrial biogenesis protein FimT
MVALPPFPYALIFLKDEVDSIMSKSFSFPQAGMTFMELLVSMVILLLMAGYAMPAMSTWHREAQIRSAGMHFRQMLDTGRYTALAGRGHVTLCPVDAAWQCSSRWQRDLMLFLDIDGDGQQQAGERALSNWRMPEGVWLEWRAFRKKPYIQWTAQGQTAALNGTFTLCNDEARPEWVRQWVVNKIGRVREVAPAKVGGDVLQAALRVCR